MIAQKVDVRGVIRAVIEDLRASGNTGMVESLLDVDAGLAELFEAGNDWCDLMPGLAGGPEFDRLTNALANTGSAS